jgi:hypothetical protein
MDAVERLDTTPEREAANSSLDQLAPHDRRLGSGQQHAQPDESRKCCIEEA